MRSGAFSVVLDVKISLALSDGEGFLCIGRDGHSLGDYGVRGLGG